MLPEAHGMEPGLDPEAHAGKLQGLQLAQATVAERHQFNIPAQELDTALTAFADSAGLRVLFASGEFAGLRSPGVSGSYDAEEALQRLLAGTGVTWHLEGDTVTLEKGAASGQGSAILLDTITVSGEKVNRSLRDTASSVTVIDERDIAQRPGLISTNSIMATTPNVVTSGTDNFAPAVRGVDGTGPAQGADAFFAGTRPRLNAQIDGRPASYNEVAFGDVSLWDVEQVETYRGPQSTLQGRNAIGGAVIVKTKDPTYTQEYGGRLIGGSDEYRQGSLMISGPLVDDQLAYRIAVDRMTSETFVNGFLPFAGTAHPGDYEMTTLRGKLLVEPHAITGFSTLITVTDSSFSGPQTESVAQPYDDHEAAFPSMPVFEPSATSGIFETTWDLGDGLVFENNLSFSKLLVKRLAPPTEGIAEIDGHETVLEPRLRFSALNGGLTGFGGVYLFRATQDESIDLFGGGVFDDEVTTAAVFGEGTYVLNDTVDLIVGGRLERENHERQGADGPFVIDLDETYKVFLPKLGLAWHVSKDVTNGAVISRGYNGGGAGFTYDVPFVSYTFDPEYVWNYEAYTRADFYGGKLSLTGNLFYSYYKDFQLPFDLNPDPDIWSFVVRNADRAVTYGTELNAVFQASPEWQVSGGLGLLKTKISRYENSNLQGNELPRAPGVTVDAGVKYQSPRGWEASADTRYTGAYYSSVTNETEGRTDSYWVVNAQLAYVVGHGRIFTFVNNLFDDQTPIMIEPGDTSTLADDDSTIVHPRTVGIGVEVWF